MSCSLSALCYCSLSIVYFTSSITSLSPLSHNQNPILLEVELHLKLLICISIFDQLDSRRKVKIGLILCVLLHLLPTLPAYSLMQATISQNGSLPPHPLQIRRDPPILVRVKSSIRNIRVSMGKSMRRRRRKNTIVINDAIATDFIHARLV